MRDFVPEGLGFAQSRLSKITLLDWSDDN
jgi:hypothetical protein